MCKAVYDFIAEVNDLVDEFCDQTTRAKYSKTYGVTNTNDKRLHHMIKYIIDQNIEVPQKRYAQLADVTSAFADYVESNDCKYTALGITLKLSISIERLREIVEFAREMADVKK